MARIEACPAMGCLLWPEPHLRAAEGGDARPAPFDADRGVPDLRGAPEVQRRRAADNRALARRAEEVGLQLDGGEAARAFGQRGDAAVAAARVGQRDDG